MHSDGVQAAGKIPVDVNSLGVDLYSISGHKLYAPKGIGALYVKNGTPLGVDPVRRASRARAPAGHRKCSGRHCARMCSRGWRKPTCAAESARIAELRDRLERGILARVPACGVNGSISQRGPQHHQHLFRRPGRRSSVDRARPERFRGIERRGLFERRGGTVARAARHRVAARTRARQPAILAGPFQHRRAGGRADRRRRRLGGALAQAFADLHQCLTTSQPSRCRAEWTAPSSRGCCSGAASAWSA